MTRDLTPEPDHAGATDSALEEWVAEIGKFHASDTELTPLVGSFDGHRCFRALWHLRRCASCREQLAALIEDMLLEQEDPPKALGQLTRLLRHEEPVVRASGARAAVTISAELADVAELVQPLVRDPDELVRGDAVVALSQIEDASEGASVEVEDIAAGLGRKIGTLVEQWQGSMSGWTGRSAVAGVALAAGKPNYLGLQSPLEPLFGRPILEGALAWAIGPLRVDAISDDQGLIQSVRVSIGVRQDVSGAPIILELSDREGCSVAMELAASRAFDVRSCARIHGRLDDLYLKLSIEERE